MSTKRNDRIFAILLFVEWFAAVALAWILTPKTWHGAESSLHPHVYQAFWIGLICGGIPAFLCWRYAGADWVKFVVACAQASIPGLFVHLVGGRIDTHFFYFGSLASLVMYRDWRVIVATTVVISGDHVIRGIWYPMSIFGSAEGGILRVIEHAWWVIFEDFFLIRACLTASHEWSVNQKQAAQLARELEESRGRASALETAAIHLTELSSTLEKAASESLSESDETLTRSEQIVMDLDEVKSAAESMAAQTTQMRELSRQSAAAASQSVVAAQSGERELATLSQATSEIGDIISTIQHLSFQINMLALNANIEAARAGEAGRGFAVVAGEVRRLAHESADSAQSIEAKLAKISEHSAKGAEVIVHIAGLVRTLAVSSEAGEATVSEQARLVDDILVRCQRVWQFSSESVRSMNTLSQAAGYTKDSAAQTSSSANSLRELATQMVGRDGH